MAIVPVSFKSNEQDGSRIVGYLLQTPLTGFPVVVRQQQIVLVFVSADRREVKEIVHTSADFSVSPVSWSLKA